MNSNGHAPSSRHRTKSARTKEGDLLDWIDEAQAAQRTWARNTLLVVAAIAAITLLLLKLGLLPQ